jgi:Tfp pilus assembly protein PilO
VKLDTRVTLVIAAVVAIAVVAGGWFLGVSPQLSAASAADTNTSQVSDQNSVMETQLAGLTAAKAKLPELQTTLTGLQSSIPDTLQGTTFLTDLSGIAADNGVVLTSITIGAIVPYAKPAGKGPYVDPLVTGSNFGTSQVSIEVTGTPDQEYAFVHALQYGTRLVLVTTLNTALTTQDATNSMTVTGFLYVMNPNIATLAPKQG